MFLFSINVYSPITRVGGIYDIFAILRWNLSKLRVLKQTNTDDQQLRSRLSNWVSLQWLGSWMHHLPPVWWATFRLMVSKRQLGIRFRKMERNFLLNSCLYAWFWTIDKFCLFPLKCFHSKTAVILSPLYCLIPQTWSPVSLITQLLRQGLIEDLMIVRTKNTRIFIIGIIRGNINVTTCHCSEIHGLKKGRYLIISQSFE